VTVWTPISLTRGGTHDRDRTRFRLALAEMTDGYRFAEIVALTEERRNNDNTGRE
jgi:hypothetical protein